LAAIFVVAAFVLSVDAFAIFGSRLIPAERFPHDLRMTTSGDRVIKAIEIARIKDPLDILFAGSSRVAFAFDPRSPLLVTMHTYNAGLNGSQSYETGKVIRYAIDHGPRIRRIVWNIDFEEFFRALTVEADFGQSGFAGAPLALGYARHLLSYEALRKSAAAAAAAAQDGRFLPFVDADGFYIHERSDATKGAMDYPLMPRLRHFYPGYVLAARNRYDELLDAHLADIAATLAYARGRGVDVDVVLMPVHVTRLEVYRLTGLLPLIESWKKRLAQTLSAVAKTNGAGNIRALDFSIITSISTVDFPTRFFLETLHPGPIVGDMIVARLLDRAMPPNMADFGMPLEKAVTPERLAQDRNELHGWEENYPALVAQIETLVAQLNLTMK